MKSKENLKKILEKVESIAVVGASPNIKRDSNIVMKTLINFGYKVFPVNPNYTNKRILGRKCYPNLKSIKSKIDMVDIFRAKEFILDISKEAIKIKADVLWMQEGITNETAANLARDHGLKVVMDKCPRKILKD